MYPKSILSATLSFLLLGMTILPTIAQQKQFIDGTESRLFNYKLQPPVTPQSVGVRSPNRSYDGTNNNISGNLRKSWGSADIPFFREIAASYGPSDKKNAMSGPNRPSARKISNVMCDEPITNFNSRGLSAFVYVWGQFLDHDMSLTPTDTVEYAPVSLPADEILFTEEIPFYRSAVRAGTGVTNARQQTNLNTSWIDASMVYGTDVTRANWLRTFQNGKMKTSAGNLLPFNTYSGEQNDSIDPSSPNMANDGGHTVKTFAAGDVRASEHPGLISLHTLFVREHNRICDYLVAHGQTDDELIYQRARKEVGAVIQAITYQEFLPAIGVTLSPYVNYDITVRPDIANTFATAGYRIGHTMVADDILVLTDSCEEIFPGEFDLVEVFWNPQLIVDYNVEPFLKGFAAHTQYETDTKINSVLRNMLFGSPTDSVRFGVDLASLNIQRGRDHGLPNYNRVRQYYTGNLAVNFSDISSNPAIADSLQSLYGNINNIDLWVGILSEDRLPGKSVGTTMHAMLKSQFEKLRNGDYYFYLHDPYLKANSRNQIINSTFADLIKRNSNLTNLQVSVFFTEECPEDTLVRMSPSDNTTADFKIYPNPANDLITVDLGGYGESCTIRFYSANGALLKSIVTEAGLKSLPVNVSDLTNGIYMLKIITAKEMKSFKFIKLAK